MDRSASSSDPLSEIVRRHLAAITEAAAHRIALSGGCDSIVLLHVVHGLRLAQPLRAVHVHHGLHAEADDWAAFCERQCARLDIPVAVLRVQARAPDGESPEAWARRLRYQVLRPLLDRNEVLLTAHHQQDQAETVLLQLLRGAGPAGLAAMPVRTVFGAGSHLRPFIDVPRASLRAYAEAHGLQWIEDHSNADIRFARNYLRQRVLPVIAARWPHYAPTIARAARWQAEATTALVTLAEEDLQRVRGSHEPCVSVAGLHGLSERRMRNALRSWLTQQGLPIPGSVHLEQIARMLMARPDAQACVRWPGAEVRRYRDDLYAAAPLARHDATAEWQWDPRLSLKLPFGVLSARRSRGEGVRIDPIAASSLVVRFRRGGERCHGGAMAGGKTLKGLMQEHGVPPWLRDRVPLVYAGDELAAVANWWICGAFHARPEQDGWVIDWTTGDHK